jgi:hypothetical protein
VVEARNLTAKGHGKNAHYSVPYCMVPPSLSPQFRYVLIFNLI